MKKLGIYDVFVYLYIVVIAKTGSSYKVLAIVTNSYSIQYTGYNKPVTYQL